MLKIFSTPSNFEFITSSNLRPQNKTAEASRMWVKYSEKLKASKGERKLISAQGMRQPLDVDKPGKSEQSGQNISAEKRSKDAHSTYMWLLSHKQKYLGWCGERHSSWHVVEYPPECPIKRHYCYQIPEAHLEASNNLVSLYGHLKEAPLK